VKAVLLLDDLAVKAGKRVEADGTHILALDGKAVELDLTTGHYAELVQKLAVYFEAGSKPGINGQAPARNPRKPASWYAGLVAWAGEQGRASEVEKRGDGTVRYGRKLKADYEAHLLGARA
jgi:hypothetical protein